MCVSSQLTRLNQNKAQPSNLFIVFKFKCDPTRQKQSHIANILYELNIPVLRQSSASSW